MTYHGQKQIKKNVSKITKNMIGNLHSWICNHPQVVNLTLKNDQVNIKDNTTGEVIKTKQLIIQIPIRELHIALIKPPSEGGFLVQDQNQAM